MFQLIPFQNPARTADERDARRCREAMRSVSRWSNDESTFEEALDSLTAPTPFR